MRRGTRRCSEATLDSRTVETTRHIADGRSSGVQLSAVRRLRGGEQGFGDPLRKTQPKRVGNFGLLTAPENCAK